MKLMQWRSSEKCVMTEAHGASGEEAETRPGRPGAAWPRSEGSGRSCGVTTAAVAVLKMNKLLKKISFENKPRHLCI